MKIFIHQNASENIFYKMAAILSRGDESISLNSQNTPYLFLKELCIRAVNCEDSWEHLPCYKGTTL